MNQPANDHRYRDSENPSKDYTFCRNPFHILYTVDYTNAYNTAGYSMSGANRNTEY